jgi:hypothetical protein
MSLHEKNSLLQEHNLLEQHNAYYPRARRNSGNFAESMASSVEHLVQGAWGMSKQYISKLKRQLRIARADSDLDNYVLNIAPLPSEG